MEPLINLISFLILLLWAWPVCLVLHETGHAGLLLLLTRQKVTIQFGVRGPKREIQWSRLTIRLYIEPGAFLGARFFYENYAALSRKQIIWSILGGPLASLLLAILCAAMWLPSNTIDPWRGLAIINLIGFLNSSLPRYYDPWQGIQGGIPNDGLQLVQLMRRA
jgi:hypothetical protein